MSVKLKIDSNYPYVYETHLHTSEGSKCARSTGREMADACFEAGYTGIMVTDHFYYGNTAIDRSLSWEDWVQEYCKGYEHVKKEGDRIGLQVFFGWESTYEGTDFLIYGLDKEWLLHHQEIRDASVPEQFELVHRYGGIVIHAHPYREDFYIPGIKLYPDYVDAVETANATHTSKFSTNHYNPEFDKKAVIYAKEHDFPVTAGSDVHSTTLLFGGVACREPLKNLKDYMDMVVNRGDFKLLDGSQIIE